MTASAPISGSPGSLATEIVTSRRTAAQAGRSATRRWERPALVGLLAATALLYLWGLSASGWANAFYSAAAEAGSQSWKAFFFGSFDASSFITVDKTPAALWVMGLSARLFGVNAWSILAPEAIEGVAAVGLLYATVRRWFSPGAALLAGAVMALTPAAALMFRFNNPDALLTLLLVASAYALTRALEEGRTGWLLLAGALIGLGFLTKMLQAFLVVPGFAFVYLVAAPGSARRRVVQVAAAGLAVLVSAGWWVAVVMLTPAGSRPYIGGSQDNSILNLTFGYNGFGRLTGNEHGSVGGIPGAPGRWGLTGLLRLFGPEMGGQVSWLLPAAGIALVAMLVVAGLAPRTDRLRAAALLWGSWLLVTGLVFSLAQGIIHPYYTVALAPPIGALVGIGAASLWQRRGRWLARCMLAAALAVTVWWAMRLLARTPDWHPQLAPGIVALGAVSALALLIVSRLPRGARTAVVALALIAALAGPAAFALQTAGTAHSGAIPAAGPAVTARGGFGGNQFATVGPGFRIPSGGAGSRGRGSVGGFGTFPPRAPGMRGTGGNSQTGLGGLLNAGHPSAALVRLLTSGSAGFTWVAATVGANNAAGIQLAVGQPVMAIGGFNGTDPAPTLAQFQQIVAAGKIHYFLGGGGIGGFGPASFGRGTASEIAEWVTTHFATTTAGGQTVYDLTQPLAAGTPGA